MPDLLIDGNTLHYSDQGTGPGVLLGHSYLRDKGMWSAQNDTHASQNPVNVPEHRGQGDT
ncbi:alpha/beta hydrolase, partial [Pseudomonas syringae pv. tagetis]